MKTRLLAVAVVSLALSTFPVYAGDLTADNITANKDMAIYGKLEVKGVSASTASTNLQELYYSLNTNTTPVPDDSGNGHTGTVSGATWTTSGYVGGAYTFNGTNWISSGSITNIGTNFTVTAWMKSYHRKKGGGIETMVSKTSSARNDGSPPWIFGLYSNGLLWACHDGASEYSDSTGIQTGSWYHVVFKVTEGKVYYYVNGVSCGSDNFSFPDDQNYVFVGSLFAFRDDENWTGLIDELRIYRTALSSEEIAQAYHAGTSGTAPGETTFYSGIKYAAPLGDVGMGSFTNNP